LKSEKWVNLSLGYGSSVGQQGGFAIRRQKEAGLAIAAIDS
jgi:hypothetical protein